MKFESRNKLILILIFIGLLSIVLNILPNNQKIGISYKESYPEPSKISSKIHIDNNWTDVKAADICTGEGTSSNPYIIADLEINAGTSNSCILVENSNAYFIIKNCTLSNSGSEIHDSGIRLINVERATILNNTLFGNFNGIFIEYSSNSLIVNNTFNNDYDLQAIFSNNIMLYLNNFYSSAVSFFYYQTTFSCKSPQKLIYIYNETSYTNFLGNYWHNYHENDTNGDGIGDFPHFDVDYYPLYQPISFYEIVGIYQNTDPQIPGYNLVLLLGIISIISLIILKRELNTSK